MPKDLTSELLTILLAKLSSDEIEAGRLYTELHDSLARFFFNKGISEAEQCADETIDRVARRLQEKTVIDDVSSFAFGVAKFVFLEQLRKEQIKLRAAGQFHRAGKSEPVDLNQRVESLRHCLDALFERDRQIILEYFRDGDVDEGRRSDVRSRLSEREGISLNALRNRVARIKERLAKCLDGRT